jgi:hypothetical protein
MRKTIIMTLLLVAVAAGSLYAQILTPVKWSYAAKRTGPKAATVFIKATIDEGWHIYSAYQKEGGPVKTSFTFEPSKDYSLVGGISEPQPVTKFEKTFAMNVSYFGREVVFSQKVRLKTAFPVIKGSLNFMVCNDQKCLPPEDVAFMVPVK